jgi:succinate dehydrogenase / fumarate reductase flavoprotein subunit
MTVGDYLAEVRQSRVTMDHPAVKEAINDAHARTKRLLSIDGTRSVDSFHRELGRIMWQYCGMARTDASLRTALNEIPQLREQFWRDVKVPGDNGELNQELEKAGRVADFLELAELICIDALHRTESAGGHFREESQTEDGEALRDDENFSYVAAWMMGDDLSHPTLVKEPLTFENIHLAQRSYK